MTSSGEVGRTARLSFESLGPEHAARLFEDLLDPRLYAFIPGEPPSSIAALTTRFERLAGGSGTDRERWRNWVMLAHENGEAVGTLQATVRPGESTLIAYSVWPRCWRRGFASEGVGWMIDQLARLEGAAVAEALIDTRNAASIALVERLGFERIETILDADFFAGETSHEHRYQRRLAAPVA